MKSLLTVILVLGIASGRGLACDICGCAVGGNFLGILPGFKQHFAGLRLQSRAYRSTHPSLFGNGQASGSEEGYYTAELWGRWSVRHNVQVFGFLPYHHFSRAEEGVNYHARGLGDASLLLSWVLLNSGDSSRRSFRHALQLGGGVKLPTGSARLRTSDGLRLPRNMQPGSGSVDFPVNISYTLRYRTLGLATEANMRFNTADADAYRFGWRSSLAARLFYWKQLRNHALLPAAGFFWEKNLADSSAGTPEEFTGGEALWASAGFDYFLNRWSFSVLYQHPLAATLGEGLIQPLPRASAGISVFF